MPRAKVKSRKDNRGRVLKHGEGQRKNTGMYYFQYTDFAGKRRVIYSKDLQSLREKEKSLVKDQLDGIDTYAAGRMTLNEQFDRYIATKLRLKENTRINYKYMYDHCVRENFGRRIIRDIRYSDIKLFYNSLLDKQGLKSNTLETINTLLHPTFSMAVHDGIIRYNPTDGVMAEIKKECGNDNGVRHALTLEQQRAFLNYVESNPAYQRWYPLFVFLFGTGCRIGEVIGIRWEDVDLENQLIDINHATVYLARGERKSGFHISTTKTYAGKRIIPLMSTVRDALQLEYEYQQVHGSNIDEIDGMTGFLFCNREGRILSPSVINRTIKRIYEAYNSEEILKASKEKREPILIPHFTCHHIRHTFCTRFCENETNLKVIQDIMGHANIETTMDIYAEATQSKKKQAMTALEHNSNMF